MQNLPNPLLSCMQPVLQGESKVVSAIGSESASLKKF